MKTTKPTDKKRSVRVAERVRVELEEIFARGLIRDPAAKGALVSNVKITDDLRIARIYVRRLASTVGDAEKAALVAALRKTSGLLRRELSSRLQLRYTPDLEFFWDEGADHAMHMDDLFAEIRRERGE